VPLIIVKISETSLMFKPFTRSIKSEIKIREEVLYLIKEISLFIYLHKKWNCNDRVSVHFDEGTCFMQTTANSIVLQP
jgi:hypothetical protein